MKKNIINDFLWIACFILLITYLIIKTRWMLATLLAGCTYATIQSVKKYIES